MSYCRFSHDKSDVYVFRNEHNLYECCTCKISESGYFTCKKKEAMIKHLMKHRKAGHVVPEYAIEKIRKGD